jgi:hypothetical protein
MTASRNDWKTMPLPVARAAITCDRAYSADEFAKIRAGHVPEEMEDKWFAFYEEPWLYLHRSWTGCGIFDVRFEPAGDGARVVEVLVNRDAEQYTSTDDTSDSLLLALLLDQYAGRATDVALEQYLAWQSSSPPSSPPTRSGRRSALRPARLPPVLAGVAGEYFVAAELSRRGYIASISLRNTRGIDVLATNQDGSRSVTIQCKTSQRTQKRWVLNAKSEDFVSPTHFYVFVLLGAIGAHPQYHVVPSRDVAKYLKADHKKWMSTAGRGGRKHMDNSVRVFADKNDKYLDRWDLLGL